MADFRPALWLAINTRLTGDSTLTGYVPADRITNVWEKAAGDGAAYPAVCLTDVDGQRTDAFATKIIDYQFDVHTFVAYSVSGQDGLLVGSTILERIEGPWPTTVSYGLDRWQPDITATGYTCDYIRQMGEPTANHGDGVYHWILHYAAEVSRS